MIRQLLLVSALAVASALEFDCSSLVPFRRNRAEVETNTPFIMHMDTSKTYKTGDTLTVRIQSHTQRFDKFVVQARRPLDDVALGEFVVDSKDRICKLDRCINAGDTVTNRENTLINEFTVVWRVPDQIEGIPEVEFDVTIAHGRKFWIFNTMMVSLEAPKAPETPKHPTAEEERKHGSVPVPDDDVPQQEPPKEEEGTGEDPNEPERREQEEREEADRRDHVSPNNMHDPKTEQELTLQEEERKRKEIEEEDKYSEGDWQKVEAEERRQHEEEMHEEEIEYERLQAEEEYERQKRIQFELLDKEEHDAQKTSVEEPAGGDIGGGIDLGDPEGIPLSDL